MNGTDSRAVVVTAVAGRHDHLRTQREWLIRSHRQPLRHVVVAMDDPQVRSLLRDEPGCTVVDLESAPPLPLARARNIGAETALSMGAHVLVFLDVDCLPSPGLVARYEKLATSRASERSVLCGQVRYLSRRATDDQDLHRLVAESVPHPARPGLGDADVVPTSQYGMFWSLSFAMRAETWRALGGFCEEYAGYGGEDTDFGQSMRARGVGMAWVGGADTYHQFHPVSDPPVEHLDAILRNAHVFRERWGWWPMEGWLAGFAALGLIEHDLPSDRWLRMSDASRHDGSR